jgi:NAD(P)-dependent dehydrogenase (short-subunit alcohol dehydrogenase family)
MTTLNSVPGNLAVAVAGASGGIGAEFVRQLAGDERVARVCALSRGPFAFPGGKVTAVRMDIGDEDSIAAAAKAGSRDEFDLAVVATGGFSPGMAPR